MDGMAYEGRLRKLFARPDSKRSWSAVRQLAWKAIRGKMNFRRGEGIEVLQRVERSKFRASKKLLEHVGALLKGRPEYTLLDEQLVAFERVMASAREGFAGRR